MIKSDFFHLVQLIKFINFPLIFQRNIKSSSKNQFKKYFQMNIRSKSSSSFQTCPIRQLYNIAYKTQLQKSYIREYQLVRKSASDYFLNKKNRQSISSNNHPPKTNQKANLQSKIPGPGYYLKTPTFAQQLKDKSKKPILQLKSTNQKKIDKQQKSSPGPGTYQTQKFQQYLQKRQNQRPNKCSQRVLYTEFSQARSIEIPSIGQYNIGNVKSQKKKAPYAKWNQRAPNEWIQLHKSLQKSLKKAYTGPSPQQYNPMPRSYSLFCNKTKKKRQGFESHQKERYQKCKQNQQKFYKIRSKKNKKVGVGPGKYLSLEDWNNKLKDKKGYNFVSGQRRQSIYY